MSGRFLSRYDLAEARRVSERFNAALKRGEVPQAHRITYTRHIVCGCGAPGCVFLYAHRRDDA